MSCSVNALSGLPVSRGEAGDRIFHKTGSKQQQGSTGLLTRGMVDRDMFYGHAMILAMVPFINPDLY